MKQDAKQQARGPWIHRAAIRFFTVVLAVLVYWLLGFVVRDIGNLPGPDWSAIEEAHLDAGQVARRVELAREIGDLQRGLERLRDRQKILSAGTEGLKGTMDQLLDLQRLSLEKGVEVSAEEQATFRNTLQGFLANQDEFQSLNRDIAEQADMVSTRQEELRIVQEGLEAQRTVAREDFAVQQRRHNLKVAAIKLAVLIPLLLAAGVMLVKMRGRMYFPMVLAFGAAVLAKALLVMHEHFPARVFRYLLIGAALVVVIRILMHFIRTLAFPKRAWLVKQYREAYERFLCPVCEYPIRRGPMKFLYWTRRSVKRLRLPAGSGAAEDGTYVCPSCNTRLYEPCPECGKTRHALLPYCEHCGAETTITAIPAAES
jgi:hypothetical protein